MRNQPEWRQFSVQDQVYQILVRQTRHRLMWPSLNQDWINPNHHFSLRTYSRVHLCIGVVQVWMEHLPRWGPGMSGTFCRIWSRYEWNISNIGGQIWVERCSIGARYEWNAFKFSNDFLEIRFISGRIWLHHKIRFIAHNFHLSNLTGYEPNLQEKHLKILKRSTHTWPPLNNVPLIPGPLYARCSTHILTPILLMFHSYLDPILQNVPLISGPHLD